MSLQTEIAADGAVPLTKHEFEQISRLAHERFGLDLHRGKEQLVSARLGKKLREAQFRSFAEYYRHVVADPTGEALIGMIDALTTNYTSFLRESVHFDFLREQVWPLLRERGQISVWSAGCATGEEPYTLACCLLEDLEAAGARSCRIRIVASDISTKALKTAQAGIYKAERFEGFPKPWFRKYLLRGEQQWQGHYRFRPEVRSLIEYRRVNLIENFQMAERFSVIFCRNVMIYFDKPTQEVVVNHLSDCLEQDGYLLVGHSETLTGLNHALSYVRPATYQKNGRARRGLR